MIGRHYTFNGLTLGSIVLFFGDMGEKDERANIEHTKPTLSFHQQDLYVERGQQLRQARFLSANGDYATKLREIDNVARLRETSKKRRGFVELRRQC